MEFSKIGRITITKDLYNSEEIDSYLFNLEMKIYEINLIPYTNCFRIVFTSKYLPEIAEGTEIPEYEIIRNNGLNFMRKQNA